MRILFIGDVVGQVGRECIRTQLPKLKQEYRPQITIVNGENAAHGRGITEKIYKELLQAGADVITLGNHAWDQKEIYEWIDQAKNLLRPLNYPVAYGQGSCLITVNDEKLGVINAQGRTFMPEIDNPFPLVKAEVERLQKAGATSIFVDFHAEATSEKQALAAYLDGEITALCGTHTHVATKDAHLLPKGTAYLTDVGMTGPEDSILGMKTEAVLARFLTSLPTRFEVEEKGRRVLSYAVIDSAKGKKTANKIINESLRYDG